MKIFKAEDYFKFDREFKNELIELRKMCLNKGLAETIKWGMPVYTLDGQNIVGIAAFKNHYGLWFFQGALLKDEKNILINAQEGKTQAMRQIRFEKGDEIQEELMGQYLDEAIENQRLGKTVEIEKKVAPKVPELLKKRMAESEELSKKLEEFTPAKRNEFYEFINEAKKEITKENRVEKVLDLIKEGKSLNEKYR